ncbi:MAG: hypothetical protein U0441_07200 [Polyangiaceae bacterium]
MNQACVSLEEVLLAAAARAASLVPETSGYLALAVADATSRLPYAHEDRGVLLTIDGSVMVPRKAPIAPPPEAARVLRDLLRRLLATSTGTMPGLASAARPRTEESDVDRVVGDIEGALIPVNRAAAKRALARLARETLRAKELGKLKRSAPQPAAKPAAAPAPKPAAPAPQPIAAPPQPAAIAAPVVVPVAPMIAPPPMVMTPPLTLADLITPQPAEPSIPEPIAKASEPIVTAPAPIEEAPAPAPEEIVAKPEPMAEAPAPSIAHEVITAAPEPIAAAPEPIVTLTPSPESPSDVAPTVAPPTVAPPRVVEPSELTDIANVSMEAIEAALSAETPSRWDEPDATIADPDAMAVIESLHREGTLALDAPDLDDAPSFGEAPHFSAARFSDAADLDEVPVDEGTAIPASVHATANKAPLQIVIEDAPFVRADPPAPAIVRRPTEIAVPDPLTAEAGPVALISQLAGSRADELLESFGAEDQGDRAVAAAAGSLRKMTGVDETASPRPAATPTFLRVPPPPRRQIQALEDLDDDLGLPPPRPRTPKASKWPLAIFAVGVLALFAAWLYRPTLAHDLFGLVSRLRAAPAVAVEGAPTEVAAPAPANEEAPARAASTAISDAPATAPNAARPRDARASSASADGTRRRRD